MADSEKERKLETGFFKSIYSFVQSRLIMKMVVKKTDNEIKDCFTIGPKFDAIVEESDWDTGPDKARDLPLKMLALVDSDVPDNDTEKSLADSGLSGSLSSLMSDDPGPSMPQITEQSAMPAINPDMPAINTDMPAINPDMPAMTEISVMTDLITKTEEKEELYLSNENDDEQFYSRTEEKEMELCLNRIDINDSSSDEEEEFYSRTEEMEIELGILKISIDDSDSGSDEEFDLSIE